MSSLQRDILIESTENAEELQFYLPDPLDITSHSTMSLVEHIYGHGLAAIKERALWVFSRPVQEMRRRHIFRQARTHY